MPLGTGPNARSRSDRMPVPRWVLAVALFSAGCQQLPTRPACDDVAEATSADGREAQMNQRWQMRPMSELVQALGQPALAMSIPGGGNPPGFALVFGKHAATGCLDAFAMMPGRDPVVRNYYCR